MAFETGTICAPSTTTSASTTYIIKKKPVMEVSSPEMEVSYCSNNHGSNSNSGGKRCTVKVNALKRCKTQSHIGIVSSNHTQTYTNGREPYFNNNAAQPVLRHNSGPNFPDETQIEANFDSEVQPKHGEVCAPDSEVISNNFFEYLCHYCKGYKKKRKCDFAGHRDGQLARYMKRNTDNSFNRNTRLNIEKSIPATTSIQRTESNLEPHIQPKITLDGPLVENNSTYATSSNNRLESLLLSVDQNLCMDVSLTENVEAELIEYIDNAQKANELSNQTKRGSNIERNEYSAKNALDKLYILQNITNAGKLSP